MFATAPAIAQAPIAAYTFEAGSGSLVADVSGNGHDGAVAGTATWSTGIPSQCAASGGMRFLAVNDGVTVPDAPQLHATSAFTVGAWAKVAPAATSSPRALVGKRLGTGFDNSFILLVRSDGRARFIASNGTTAVFVEIAGPVVTDDVWHHFAGTLVAGQIRLYVDGALAATAPLPGGIGYDTNPITLGNDINNGAFSEPLIGLLDEVRIYDVGFGPALVAALYAASERAIVTPRTGSGVNPTLLGSATRPVLGASWNTTIALPSGGVSLLGLAPMAIGPTPTPLGELLVGPIVDILVGTGSHAFAIPGNCALVGYEFSAQGARWDGAGLVLGNALDLRVGSF